MHPTTYLVGCVIQKRSTCRYAPGCETKSSDAKDEPLLQVDTKTSLTCMIPGLKGEVFSFWLKLAVCFDIFFLGNVY